MLHNDNQKQEQLQTLSDEERSSELFEKGRAYQSKKEYNTAILYYEQAIPLGNANATNNRAYMHMHGLGGPVDHPAAIALYEQVIKLGNTSAMGNRAYMHQCGIGGPVDYPAAIALYEQAIKLGNTSAMGNRAYMHRFGLGGPVDYPAAIALYEQAIKLGNTSAMGNRAYMHRFGLGGPINSPAAISLYLDVLAEINDDAKANKIISAIKEIIATKNERDALPAALLLRLLSTDQLKQEVLSVLLPEKEKHSTKLCKEGDAYHHKKEYSTAIQYYKHAIQLGHADAMNNRAYMHQCGIGGPINSPAAISLYLDALAKIKDETLANKIITNLKEIIATKNNRDALPAALILRLVDAGHLENESINLFEDQRLKLLTHIRCLEEDAQYQTAKNALDTSHPLGKLFARPEGFVASLFNRPSDPLQAGTLLNEMYELFKTLDNKRKSPITAARSDTTTTLTATFMQSAKQEDQPILLTTPAQQEQPPAALSASAASFCLDSTYSNVDSALKLQEEKSQLNEANRQYNYGCQTRNDYANAIKYYDRAIYLGSVDAMHNRALMHEQGLGGEVDYAAAMTLFLDILMLSNVAEVDPKIFRSATIKIQEIINKHQDKLPVELVFRLFNSGFLPEDGVACFKSRQRDLLDYIRTLPKQELYDTTKNILDESHALGKLFRLPQAIFATFVSNPMTTFFSKPVDPLDRGTPLNEVYWLHYALEAKRNPQIFSLPADAASLKLESIYDARHRNHFSDTGSNPLYFFSSLSLTNQTPTTLPPQPGRQSEDGRVPRPELTQQLNAALAGNIDAFKALNKLMESKGSLREDEIKMIIAKTEDVIKEEAKEDKDKDQKINACRLRASMHKFGLGEKDGKPDLNSPLKLYDEVRQLIESKKRPLRKA